MGQTDSLGAVAIVQAFITENRGPAHRHQNRASSFAPPSLFLGSGGHSDWWPYFLCILSFSAEVAKFSILF